MYTQEFQSKCRPVLRHGDDVHGIIGIGSYNCSRDDVMEKNSEVCLRENIENAISVHQRVNISSFLALFSSVTLERRMEDGGKAIKKSAMMMSLQK